MQGKRRSGCGVHNEGFSVAGGDVMMVPASGVVYLVMNKQWERVPVV